MTVTLTPNTETRLRQKAARTGQETDMLVEVILSNALIEEDAEEELRAEYRRLVASEMRGTLSEAMTVRLAEVTQDMDASDMNSPAAQAMFKRLTETDQKNEQRVLLQAYLADISVFVEPPVFSH